jgi:hypothetical protein
MQEQIRVGDLAFVSDGELAFGAVREIAPDGRAELVVYVENAGHFVVPVEAVEAVHSGKVVVSFRKLGSDLQAAIKHAHDAEDPGT